MKRLNKALRTVYWIIFFSYTIYTFIAVFHVDVPGSRGHCSIFTAKEAFYDGSDAGDKDRCFFAIYRIRWDKPSVHEKLWSEVEGVQDVSIEYVDAFLKSHVDGYIQFEDMRIEIHSGRLYTLTGGEKYCYEKKLDAFSDLYWKWRLKKTALIGCIWIGMLLVFAGTFVPMIERRREIFREKKKAKEQSRNEVDRTLQGAIAVCMIAGSFLIITSLIMFTYNNQDVNIIRSILTGTALIVWRRTVIICLSVNLLWWAAVLLKGRKLDLAQRKIKRFFRIYVIFWVALMAMLIFQQARADGARRSRAVSDKERQEIRKLGNIEDFESYGKVRLFEYNMITRVSDYYVSDYIEYKDGGTLVLEDGTALDLEMRITYYEAKSVDTAHMIAEQQEVWDKKYTHLYKEANNKTDRNEGNGDYFACYCTATVGAPTAVIQNGNKVIKVTFLQEPEDICDNNTEKIPDSEWIEIFYNNLEQTQ